MLAESLVYARSFWRTPAPFRPHLAEAVGLWARGQRQFRAWTPHLKKTLGTIDASIDDIGSRRTVAVLGSGPLFDVPIEALARTFERVLLIDRIHLAASDHRIAPYPNVQRLWRDLAPAGEPKPLAFLGDIPTLDWVVSLNLLSQIAHGAPDGAERQAIEHHLGGLAALARPVTLITDIDYRIFDRAGTLLEEADLVHGHPMPPPESRWLWEVAPFGEDGRDTRRIHTVFAYPEWHRTIDRRASFF